METEGKVKEKQRDPKGKTGNPLFRAYFIAKWRWRRRLLRGHWGAGLPIRGPARAFRLLEKHEAAPKRKLLFGLATIGFGQKAVQVLPDPSHWKACTLVSGQVCIACLLPACLSVLASANLLDQPCLFRSNHCWDDGCQKRKRIILEVQEILL